MKCDCEGCKIVVDPAYRFTPMLFDEGVDRYFCGESHKAQYLRQKWRRQADAVQSLRKDEGAA